MHSYRFKLIRSWRFKVRLCERESTALIADANSCPRLSELRIAKELRRSSVARGAAKRCAKCSGCNDFQRRAARVKVNSKARWHH
jgi:hypothetical protein